MYAVILHSIIILIGIAALISAYLVARRQRLKVEQRINMVARSNDPNIANSGGGEFINALLNQVNSYIKRIFALGIGSDWGMTSGAGKLMLLAIAGAFFVWLLGYYLLDMHNLVIAGLSLLTAFLVPNRKLLKEQRKAERKFNERFPDAIDMVARMLRAGMPATSAIRTVGEDAPEPVSQVFRKISHQMQIGIPLSDALADSSQKINLPDFRFFAVAVNLQFSTGGNLVFTLETLSNIIRKRHAVRNKAKALTSEIRLSAYVLGSLPFLTLGALLLIQPGYLSPLFYDSRGHAILGMTVGGLLLSVLTMKKMMSSVTNG